MWTDEVGSLLGRDDLGDLESLPLEDIRAMRAECHRIEEKVSYLRRLVQGRLDIVTADRDRRATGAGPSDLPTLVDRLPTILGDRVHAPGPGRLPTSLAPPELDDDWLAELDDLAGAPTLVHLSDSTDEAVRELAEHLADLERRVSDRRRGIFDRIDALQAELVRRYRSGEATVSSVLG